MTRANQGKAWERLLEAWCDRYRVAGMLSWERGNPPVKVLSAIGPDGRFRACWGGDGPPDFGGSFAPNGRAFKFDAKDCDQNRWPLASLEHHQARDLDRADRVGALSFVALRLQGSCWVLPWASLSKPWSAWYATTGRAAAGTASLSVEDCDVLGWRMPEPGDWLGALP